MWLPPHQQAADELGGNLLGGWQKIALCSPGSSCINGMAMGVALEVAWRYCLRVFECARKNESFRVSVMSEEQRAAFSKAVNADASLQEKLKAAADAYNDSVGAIAKEAGFLISVDELKKAQLETSDAEVRCISEEQKGDVEWSSPRRFRLTSPEVTTLHVSYLVFLPFVTLGSVDSHAVPRPSIRGNQLGY